MNSGVRDSLKEAVRRLASRISLDSLRKRGVKEVSVLGIDRIIALIDEAVYRGLKSRMYGIEREAVTAATKAEFLRLLRSNEDLQRSRSELEQLKQRAEEEVDMLRRELEAQRHALARKLEQGELERRTRQEGEDARIAAVVEELFGALAVAPDLDLALVREKVLELTMDLVGRERASAVEARNALHDEEVDRLQRRIGKLAETLGRNEALLREVTAMKDIDQGISSVYRQVQGLRGHESNYARKQELMREIFRANLRLQKGEA